MVGSGSVWCPQALGREPILTAAHAELDHTDQGCVHQFFGNHSNARVPLAAA